MISSVIFDIGRVLVSYDWKSYLESFGYDKEKEDAIAHAMFAGPYWKELDRGVWSEEKLLEAFTSLAPSCASEIREVFSRAELCISGLFYARPWISELKSKGFQVYYLSNYSEIMRFKTTEALNFLDLMDGGLFSYEVKMVKPEPEIFLELLKRYPQIRPEEAVFFDDTAENVEAACRLGFHGILFQNQSQAMEELQKLV